MPGELGDAVDERGDLVAELLPHLAQRRARVLDGVVQQRRAQRGGVEPHARADLRDADRVDDEVLAAGAALVGVALAGEHEGLLDQLAVDRLGGLARVLLDDREQVAEQDALVLGELGRGRPRARRRGARRPGGARSRGPDPGRRPCAVGDRRRCRRRSALDGGLALGGGAPLRGALRPRARAAARFAGDFARRSGTRLPVAAWQLRHDIESRARSRAHRIALRRRVPAPPRGQVGRQGALDRASRSAAAR